MLIFSLLNDWICSIRDLASSFYEDFNHKVMTVVVFPIFFKHFKTFTLISWAESFRSAMTLPAAAPRDDMTATSSPPTEFTPGTGATEGTGGVSQADAIPRLTTAPSGSPEPLTPLSTLKPMSSQESKALGSHSTATTMILSTTPAGDSSVSQHCKWAVNCKLCLSVLSLKKKRYMMICDRNH